MEITEDDFASEFSSDDDEFLALTLKPHKEDEILEAKGEIAVLRSRIEALETQKHHQVDQLVLQSKEKEKENAVKIEQLEELVKRLESEKKFLSVEVRNLGHKKRKRPQSEQCERDDATRSEGSTPDSVTTVTATTTTTAPPPTAPKAKEQVNLTPIYVDDNAQLIDSILSYTIPSTTTTTMGMLSKISLSDDFIFEGFAVAKATPLNTLILEFLVQQRPLHRIDGYVTTITHFLCSLISTLFISPKRYQRFPIPYLLPLIHATVTFKPSAVTKETMKQTIVVQSDIISHLEACIKPTEVVSEHYARHKRLGVAGIQFEMVDHFILVFACNIVESLLMICAEDHEFVKEVVEKASLLAFVKHAMNSSSNANVMMSVANWLICLIEAYGEFPLSGLDIKLMAQVVETSVEQQRGWLFHGLNNLVGGAAESVYLESLVGETLKSTPAVIYKLSNIDDFQLELQHEMHTLQLQMLLVNVFTKMVIFIPSSIRCFNSRPEIFKCLVFAIGISQETIQTAPRTPTTHERSAFISSLIRLIHMIWEVTAIEGGSSPAISKDTSHELVITLARVAFSNTATSRDAAEFLLSVRGDDAFIPVFNRWAEERALELAHIDLAQKKVDDKDKVLAIVHAQMGFSNGVEFAYDDDVVECARDVLEKCTTMDEAEALYMAMNIMETQDDEMMSM